MTRMKSKGNGHHQEESSDKKPRHFLKIILPFVIQEEKLEIPKRFSMKFHDELSAVATLTVSNDCIWRVGLENIEGRIWLNEGWQKLVKYYSIKAGHLLVFRYEGNSCFRVHIFDKTACEIDYLGLSNTAEPSDVKQCSVKHEKEIQDDDSPLVVESTRPSPSHIPLNTGIFFKHSAEPVKRKRDDDPSHQTLSGSSVGVSLGFNKQTRTVAYLKKQAFGCMTRSNEHMMEGHQERSDLDNVKTLKRRKLNKKTYSDVHELPAEMYFTKNGRPAATLQMEGAIFAARRFKPESPAFLFILRKRSRHVYVPAEFSRKYWDQVSGHVTLQVSDGREWSIKCCKRNRYMFLRQGWTEFVLENQLEEADVCIFELVKTDNVVFKVSLFRAVENAGN